MVVKMDVDPYVSPSSTFSVLFVHWTGDSQWSLPEHHSHIFRLTQLAFSFSSQKESDCNTTPNTGALLL